MISEYEHRIDKALGKTMREVRLSRRMLLTEIGDSIGVSQQQVSKYELGQNRISVSKLVLIADKLNVNIGYLAGDLEWKAACSPTATIDKEG